MSVDETTNPRQAMQRRADEFAVMEATLMKVLGVISTTALLLMLGATLFLPMRRTNIK